MQHTIILSMALLATSALSAQAPNPVTRPVDLAICLDTSGSMSGLIDAARRNLWAIVNDLALADPAPRLRVALLTFGNDGHDAARGWVALDSPFTDDLDRISQQLFALTTNGGTELVGRVLKTAVEELEWSDDPQALRLIVVAGNESAEQDVEVPIQTASGQAIARGILVNSIYCGNPADQIAPGWRQVATFADGEFAAIDHDHGTVVVATPFDARLTELSAALNTTYVPYGTRWVASAENQRAQDRNAATVDVATAAQRAVCKATLNYQCASWDLVDAIRLEQVKLEELDKADLPDELRKLSADELRAHVETQAARRAGLQAEVVDLGRQREEFVVKELERRALDGDASFEFAVRRAVRSQAEAKGFAFRTQAPIAAEAAPSTDSK